MHNRPGRSPRETRPWAGLRIWVLLLVVPACAAVMSLPALVLTVALVLTLVLPAAVWLALHAATSRELRSHAPRALRFGGQTSVTLLGFGGLFAFSTLLGGAALAAYVVSVAVSRVPRHTDHPALIPAFETAPDDLDPIGWQPQAGEVVTVEQARNMSDADLCRAWRRSFVTLQRTRGVVRRAQVVATRQLLLDEVESRYPGGLRAWLASGARAAGGPDRYLGSPGPEGGWPEAA